MGVKQGRLSLSAASARGIEDGFAQHKWLQTGSRGCFGAAGLRSAFGG